MITWTDKTYDRMDDSSNGEWYLAELTPEHAIERLCRLCDRVGWSATAPLVAAFSILIHRYTRGQAEITLDLTISPHGTEDSPDPAITLGLPLNGNQTVSETLTSVDRSLDGLLDSMPGSDERFILTMNWTDGANGGRDGLTARVHFTGDAVCTEWECRRPLGLTEPSLRVGEHWSAMLSAIPDHLDTPVSRVPFLGELEKRTIMTEWRGTPYDERLMLVEHLHHMFEENANAHPDRTAIICEDRVLTYAQVDAESNRLAGHLRSLGVGRGSFVGIFLPRGVEPYIAMLAIMKAGAAYVPIDPAYPADRVAYILQDSGAAALISVSELSDGLTELPCRAVLLDRDADAISRCSSDGIFSDEEISPEDPAYVIYTSGTTGRPKGVLIEHRNVCNFVRAEGRVFGVRPDDRVYQGFSVAFDASIEEIWLAFHSGAALVVGTEEMVHAGPELSRMLTDAGVTVLSCVPTLLSMMEGEMPTVRLLILGGEQCPSDLVRRWWRPDRRLVNSYGPTEATVVATLTDCRPDEPVTIGKPIPNYSVYILDEQMHPVPTGVPGELHLGGSGIARGYVNRPDLTEQKFVRNPFAGQPGAPPRLYKTGDLVRFTSDGDIEFLGRIDEQVKLRGFRVELAEIESVLMRCPGIRSAVVAVREDTPGMQQLVGYVVEQRPGSFDESETRASLRTTLPSYMTPAVFVVMESFPTLASGKVNRKLLPAPVVAEPVAVDEQVETSEIGRTVLGVWRRLFAPQSVTLADDFFDLGGHSLLAARMVSELRSDPRLGDVAMLDVYRHPTLGDFIRAVESRTGSRSEAEPSGAPAEPVAERRPKPSPWSFRLCAAAQAVALYPVFALFSLPWLAIYFAFSFVRGHHALIQDAAVVLGALYGFLPAIMLASIAAKWLLIGRYKEGRYPLWGSYYLRFWLVQRIRSLVPLNYLRGTPFLAIYYRLLGARIGRDVYLGTQYMTVTDLLSIDDESSIGLDVQAHGYFVEDGMLTVGGVEIGRRCCVGARSVLHTSVKMEDDSMLGELSMLPEGAVIPAGEEWGGSPAQFRARTQETDVKSGCSPSRIVRAACGLAQFVGLFFLLPMAPMLAMVPGLLLLAGLSARVGLHWGLLATPVFSGIFIAVLCLEIALGKWLLIGRIRPGRYGVHSLYYIRKWLVDALMQMSLDILHPLYATLYLPPWFRLLGAKLGRRVEISTAGHISPDLLSLGAECFVADSACIGAMVVHRGFLNIEGASVGRRTFIGNSALVPSGAEIGSGCLVGVLSTPPSNEVFEANPGSSWLGSPSVLLPNRQASAVFSDSVTYNPPWYLYAVRGFIEFFRVTIPASLFTALSVLLLSSAAALARQEPAWELTLQFPLLYVGYASLLTLFVTALKWMVMGQYKPCTKPLWSSFVWRTEMITAAHETFSAPFLLNMLLGTPFLAWYFRLMGSEIGKRVYMETTQITEFDLAHVDDDAELNLNCTIQTHLFEDRVMKTSHVQIGRKASIGQMAVVLYDSEVREGASLRGLSLLMKGESLPAYTRWDGIPARRDDSGECRRPDPEPAASANEVEYARATGQA